MPTRGRGAHLWSADPQRGENLAALRDQDVDEARKNDIPFPHSFGENIISPAHWTDSH
jgi:hypothetical protein